MVIMAGIFYQELQGRTRVFVDELEEEFRSTNGELDQELRARVILDAP
jgi:hypothetical protein